MRVIKSLSRYSISSVCVLGSTVSVYSEPENQTLMPIVIKLLGKWQKLDCGRLRSNWLGKDVKKVWGGKLAW